MAKTITVEGRPFKLSLYHLTQDAQFVEESRRNEPLRNHLRELAARGRPTRAVTIARVLEQTGQDAEGKPTYRVLGEGWSICSVKDQFVRAAGRAIATERALFKAFGPKRLRGRVA